MQSYRIILFLATCIAPFLAARAAALVIHVPGDANTIQDGIDLSDDTDTVRVDAGNYTGEGNFDLDFGGRDIVVLSDSGPDVTIIDIEQQGRGFLFENGEPPTAVVDGFTILHGDPTLSGNAFYINSSSPTIRNCKILEHDLDSEATGVVMIESGDPTFEQCVIENNYTLNSALAVVWVADGAPKFDKCDIINNLLAETCVVLAGGNPGFSGTSISGNDAPVAAVVVAAQAAFAGCTIGGNTGDGMHFASGAPQSLVYGTSIVGNQGAGVVIGANSSQFQNSEIKSNNASGVAFKAVGAPAASPSGAARASATSSTSTTFTNVVISGNVNTTSSGGGIRFDCSLTPVEDLAPAYINCLITGNSTGVNGGGIALCGSAVFADFAPTFSGCTIAMNNAAGQGGGIYSDVGVGGSQAAVLCDQTILYDNCAGMNGPEAYVEDDNYLVFQCSDVNVDGIEGTGFLDITDVTTGSPDFCLPPACLSGGTTAGDFDLSTTSAAAPENNSCNLLIGANPVVCTVVGIGDVPGAPVDFVLWPPSPNPFNPSTTIRFDCARAEHVTLVIYDANGRRIRTLLDTNVTASRHVVTWNGTDDGGRPVASGVYFLRLASTGPSQTQKLVLIK